MLIKKFVSNLLESNMYILEEEEHLIVIDPFVPFDNDVDSFFTSVPELLILTHEHFDHISGVNFIKERYNVPVYASVACDNNLSRPNRNLSRHFDAFCRMQSWIPDYMCDYSGDYICKADVTFSDCADVNWLGHNIRLTEAPGHSQGSIFIYVDDRFLFAGDSIFRDYPTGTRFTGGSAKDFAKITRPLIESLPGDTIVYPGHFESFKISDRCAGEE